MTPLDGGASRPIAGVARGERPLQFTADGRYLFFRSALPREFPARVFRLDVASGRREAWKELMPGEPAGLTSLQPAAISADGQTILFEYSRRLADLYLADGLK
jgi:eukaryotic-like serine/threonine-protein kinase